MLLRIPPFIRVSPSDPVAVTRVTLPNLFIAHIGPVHRFAGGVRVASYVALANGDAANNNGNWAPGGGVPAALSFIHMMRSVDDGLSWAEIDAASVNRPQLPPTNGNSQIATAGWGSFQTIYDDAAEIIYLCYIHWDYVNYATGQPYRLVIARFSAASDTWLADLTAYGDADAPELQQIQSAWGQSQTFGFMRRPSDGRFFTFWNRWEIVPGSPRPADRYDHCYTNEYTGAAWTARQKFAGAALDANDYNPYGSVLGRDNRVHCFMFSYFPADGFPPPTYRIWSRSISNAGAFDTLAIVADSSPDTSISGRFLPVTTPRTRIVGVEVQIILAMMLCTGGSPRWRAW